MFCLFLLECQLQTFKVSWQRQLCRAKQNQEAAADAGAVGEGEKTNDKVCKCMCMFPLCKRVCVCVWCLCGLSCLIVAWGFHCAVFWPFSLYIWTCKKEAQREGYLNGQI